MREMLKIGDLVVCKESGVIGTRTKFYKPTACAEQIMVRTRDGREYHAPADTWVRIKEEELQRERKTEKMLNPFGEYVLQFAENHGMTIDEAYEQPMVKARREFFSKTGM